MSYSYPIPNDKTKNQISLSALFSSLANDARPHPWTWTLTRTLKSENPKDINGVLTGVADFQILRGNSTNHGRDAISPQQQNGGNLNHDGIGIDNSDSVDSRTWSHGLEIETETEAEREKEREMEMDMEMIYREEGAMPISIGGISSGLRFTKKYIWRLGRKGSEISVWFVKVSNKNKNRGEGEANGQGQEQEEEEEADYLFHTFDIGPFVDNQGHENTGSISKGSHAGSDVDCTPPTPPLWSLSASAVDSTSYSDFDGDENNTTILTARGSHLCVNDMYYTAYAFRIWRMSEVVSWSSRHVVKGPNKNQDISNVYEKRS